MPRRPSDRHDATRISRQLGTRLRSLRKRVHWTQETLSERIGLTAEAYARIERGLSLPSFPTLLRLCNALDTRPDVLLLDAQSEMRGGPTAPADDPPGDCDEVDTLTQDLRMLDPEVVHQIAGLVSAIRRAVEGPQSPH